MSTTTTLAPAKDSLQLLHDVLERAVTLATGRDDLKPRPQQVEVARNAYRALEQRTHAADEAKTGTGKSIAYLAAVMLRAALQGERSVVSTESLSLQSQIVDKDAPVVAQAVKEVTGVDINVAVLKGWSNYVCSQSVASATEDPELKDTPLVRWAESQVRDASCAGDRHSYPDSITQAQWDDVSVSPSECIGVAQCPLADVCKPRIARDIAAESNVIVSNHSILAVQAAHAVPVVVSSKRLGRIDHVVVDEAHALPSQVRSQGAGEVSGRRVEQLVKAMGRLITDHGGTTTVADASDDGMQLAAAVTTALTPMSPNKSGQVAAIAADTDPTAAFAKPLRTWLDRVTKLTDRYSELATDRDKVKVRRFGSRCAELKAAITTSADPSTSVARWIENDPNTGEAAIRFSPVNVAGALRASLWTGVDHGDPDADQPEAPPVEEAEEYDLGVVAVSATLPKSFTFEAGLNTTVTRHASPLSDALQQSALFVPPALDGTDIAALQSPFGNRRLDTSRHMEWAANLVVELVTANRGRALILAATTSAGKLYAQRLRDKLGDHFDIHDQWSGRPLRHIVADWKDDEPSVMVGTKSLMTGVDAPGDTCSLVIVDRVPRSPKNPVDEARKDDYAERTDSDKWSADRAVYVSDAATLLEQAAGRLIRSVSDRGLVAVLDPRLRSSRGSVFTYASASRTAYLEALSELGHRPTTLTQATKFLRDLRERNK